MLPFRATGLAFAALLAVSLASPTVAQDSADVAEPASTEIAPASEASPPTDQELRAFAAASLEIEPLDLSGATVGTDEGAATQMLAILARHGISQDTYDGIAEQAENDPALAEQIAALRVAHAAPPEEEHAAMAV